MRKVFYSLVALAIATFSFTSCTPESVGQDGAQAIDKDKVCPPGNPNCND